MVFEIQLGQLACGVWNSGIRAGKKHILLSIFPSNEKINKNNGHRWLLTWLFLYLLKGM